VQGDARAVSVKGAVEGDLFDLFEHVVGQDLEVVLDLLLLHVHAEDL